MNPNKTTVLRFNPIAEITEEERKEEVLAFNGKEFMSGDIRLSKSGNRYVCIRKGTIISGVILYAVLPKN